MPGLGCTAFLQGVSGHEARILVAYSFMMDVERDGLVRPDELLQALHALPMKSPTGVTHRPGFKVPAFRAPGLPDAAVNASKRHLAWQQTSQHPYAPGTTHPHDWDRQFLPPPEARTAYDEAGRPLVPPGFRVQDTLVRLEMPQDDDEPECAGRCKMSLLVMLPMRSAGAGAFTPAPFCDFSADRTLTLLWVCKPGCRTNSGFAGSTIHDPWPAWHCSSCWISHPLPTCEFCQALWC